MVPVYLEFITLRTAIVSKIISIHDLMLLSYVGKPINPDEEKRYPRDIFWFPKTDFLAPEKPMTEVIEEEELKNNSVEMQGALNRTIVERSTGKLKALSE